MEISFEHSAAWIALIIPAAAAVGWWIYFHKSRYEDWRAGLKGALAGLRIALLVILGVLLLEPFIVSAFNEEEKPRLLVFDDVSQSLGAPERAAASSLIRANAEQLEEKYDLRFLRFGETSILEEDSVSGIGYYTNFESVIAASNERFYNQNIGAVVVGTDGIQTQGSDPRYLSMNAAAPVMALALGDSAVKPDLEISEVLNNRLVFLGNDFQVKARLRAVKLAGNSATAILSRDGSEIARTDFEINRQDFAQEVVFQIEADRVGLHRYTVDVTVFDSEVNRLNNAAETFIEVLDNRTSVMILTKHPHPDIAAFKQAIETSDQYEVTVKMVDDWDQQIENVDLFILHGLPTDAQDLNKLKVIRDERIPVLSVLNQNVSLVHFHAMDMGLNITTERNRADNATGIIHSNFNLFKAGNEQNMSRYPPLQVLFGDYTLTGQGQSLLYQRIGSVNTDKPLLVFGSKLGWKRAVLTGEGWWRWRLYARMQLDSKWLDQIVLKTVQYLALKQKRTRLNVNAPTKVAEGKEVRFEAEFYNASFELSNEPELQLTLTDSAGQEFDYRFLSDGNGYELSVGALPPGDYQWKATVQSSGEAFNQAGELLVTENKAEFVSLIADYNFLEQWTGKTGGATYYKGQEQQLIDRLINLETAKPLIHTSKQWQSIIDWKWVCFLIVLLATLEWVFRKLNGYY